MSHGKIKAVIFDFGGVFAYDVFPFTVKDIANAFRVSESEVKSALKDNSVKEFGKGNISEEEFWKRFSKILNKSLPENYNELLIKSYKKYSHIDGKMKKLALYLKKRGYKIAVLSNTISPHMNFNLERGRFSLFDVVVLSPQVHCAKPERKIYEETLNRLNVSPEEAVYFDNKEEYVLYAKKLGIKAFLFTGYNLAVDDLEKLIHLNLKNIQ